MVLSDRYGGQPRPGIARRTAKYVAGFGCGALVLAAGMSFALVSLAEALLPPKPGASRGGSTSLSAGDPVNVIGAKSPRKASTRRKPRTKRTPKKPTTKRAAPIDGAGTDK